MPSKRQPSGILNTCSLWVSATSARTTGEESPTRIKMRLWWGALTSTRTSLWAAQPEAPPPMAESNPIWSSLDEACNFPLMRLGKRFWPPAKVPPLHALLLAGNRPWCKSGPFRNWGLRCGETNSKRCWLRVLRILVRLSLISSSDLDKCSSTKIWNSSQGSRRIVLRLGDISACFHQPI